MRVLVTGPGGFLGGEITQQLLARGDEVVGVSRGEYPHLIENGVAYRRGDLADKAFTFDAIQDVDAVIHTAAVAGVWGAYEAFHRINTLATLHVIDACRRNRIDTLVFTSSPSVTFGGNDQCGVDESEPYPERYLCAYPETKALAERAVVEAHSDELRTCSLRPHLVWGEDDPHLLPRVIDRALRGRLRIVGDGQNLIDTVHVINAAAAHLDALDRLKSDPDVAGGRSYFIAQDEPVECGWWLRTICEIARVPPPTKHISLRAADTIGRVLEAAYRLIRRHEEPPMTRFVAAQLAKHHYFDISAAKDRLGYRVRVTMEEGLQRLRDAWRHRSFGN
ncbi:MAG: NAD-dependent epimerase/dehydratase family protein [Planctomycetota bacterium]